MKTLINLRTLIAIIAFSFAGNMAMAQCNGFDNHPKGEEMGKEKHVIYRAFFKEKNYEKAFPIWQEAYKYCAAGNELHYIDGAVMYREMLKNETDPAKITEYTNMVIKLYDERLECFGEKVSRKGRTKEGYILYKKGFDMYYMGADPVMALSSLTKAMELEGNELNSYAFYPLTDLYTREFIAEWNRVADAGEELSDERKNEGRATYEGLLAIIDYNLENGSEKDKKDYAKTKESIVPKWMEIEDAIFDCEYFKAKLRGSYDEDSENPEVAKDLYNMLKTKGCTVDGDPFMQELKEKYESWAANENRERQEAADAANPAKMARKAIDEGDFSEAIAKYNEAISTSDNPTLKAKYAYQIATIQAYKLNDKSAGRSAAREAISYDPSYGKSYMLIGKLYASSGSSCKGSDPFLGWAVSWAAVDQFVMAKNADPSVADEANKLIGKYSSYYPPKEECFMRGLKSGQSYRVGCWIGESTAVRYGN